MRIMPIYLLNPSAYSKQEIQYKTRVSKPEIMPDGFVRQNPGAVAFGGFFDFFTKKTVPPSEGQISCLQKSNETAGKPLVINARKINKCSEKLYNLTRADNNEHLSSGEKEERLKEVIQLLESPQFIPAKFSTTFEHKDTARTLEDIIMSAAKEYKPYILLETFGDEDSKIKECLCLDGNDHCYSVVSECLKNPEKYLDKTLDYFKYQKKCTDNNELAEYLTSGSLWYEQAMEVIALLANNNKLTGEEKVYYDEMIPIAVWYALRQKNILDTPFPLAKTWYLSSQLDDLHIIPGRIQAYAEPELLLKTVDELFSDYTIDDSHADLLQGALGIIFSNMNNPDTQKDWENLLMEKVVAQPDEEKGITEDEAKKINLKIINAYGDSSKNPRLDILDKLFKISNISINDENLSDTVKVEVLLAKLGKENIDFNSELEEDVKNLMSLFENRSFEKTLLNVAKSSNKNYKRVLNVCKNYFKAGGKPDFSLINDDYDIAKLYKDAGLTPASNDIHGANFYDVTQNIKDKNGDVFFPITAEVVELKFGNPNTLDGQNKLFDYLKKFEVPDKMFDEYSEILEIKRQGFHRNEYPEDILYINLINSPHKFTKKYTCSDFVKYLDKLKSQSAEYCERDISEYLSTMMDNSGYSHEHKDTLLIKLAFSSLSGKEQKKAIEVMAPYGVAQLPIKLFSLSTAAKLGLDRYLADYDELRDGICSMEDFYYLIGLGNSSPHLIVPSIYDVEVNDDKETLIDILISINCNNKQDKKYKQDMLNILAKNEKNISWKHCDKFGNNYLMKAILAEDYQMINFLKDKDIDITKRNQFGQSTIDLIEQSDPKIQKLFEGMKAQSQELIELVEMGNVSGAELLAKNKYININSLKDSLGRYTPLHIAARKDDIDMAKMLIRHPDIDFNAQTVAGETFATIVAERKNVRMLTDVIAKIPPEKINLNAIYNSSSELFSVYSKAVSLNKHSRKAYENRTKFFEELLKLKGADPNISSENLPPVAFTLVDVPDLELFQILANSGKLDVHKTYKGKTLQECINNKHWYRASEQVRKDFLLALSKAADLSATSSYRQKIEKDGFLTLDEIAQLVQYPNLGGIISQNLSSSNEKISHLLCDIEMTPQNTLQILTLARKIINADKKAFTYPDIFGQSAVNKVLLAENEVLFEYILKNSQLSDKDLENIAEQASLINNPTINKLIAQRIMNGGSDVNK